jgi:hypothetical protein
VEAGNWGLGGPGKSPTYHVFHLSRVPLLRIRTDVGVLSDLEEGERRTQANEQAVNQ